MVFYMKCYTATFPMLYVYPNIIIALNTIKILITACEPSFCKANECKFML